MFSRQPDDAASDEQISASSLRSFGISAHLPLKCGKPAGKDFRLI
jgi:hypothetical protein